MDKTMVLKPRLSEKTYAQSQALNAYVFVVPAGANRTTVASAVESQFGVTVEAVNILNVKGKAKRTMRKNGRPIAGSESNIKKAYVTLKQGDNIPIFASEEEAEVKDAKREKVMEKVAEKAEKKAKKEKK